MAPRGDLDNGHTYEYSSASPWSGAIRRRHPVIAVNKNRDEISLSLNPNFSLPPDQTG